MASSSEGDTEEKAALFKLHKSEGKGLLKQGALQAFERALECQADDHQRLGLL